MVAQREVHPAHVHELELVPVVIVKGDGAIAGNARPLCKIHGNFRSIHRSRIASSHVSVVAVSETREPAVVMRAAGTAALVLALALLTARIFAEGVERVVPIHSQFSLLDLSRTAGAIDAAEHERVDVAFIGTSAVWFGFEPRRFDAELAARGHPLTSFNFGLVPTFLRLQRFFADAICEAHRARGTRWTMMIYEIAPAEFLDKLVAQDLTDPSVAAYKEQVAAMTLRPAELVSELRRDPGSTLRALLAKPLGHRGPAAVFEAVSTYLYEDLEPEPWRKPVPALLAAVRPFWDLHRRTTWRPEARGFLPVDPEARAAYDEIMRLNHTERELAKQRVMATEDLGLLPMEVNAAAVERIIEQIRVLARCPERVVLVVMPLSPNIMRAMRPEARKRLSDVIAKVERDTGYPLLDFVDLPELGLDDFYDAEHLSLTVSAGKFSSLLADRVAELLDYSALPSGSAAAPGGAGRVDHPALPSGSAASPGKPDLRDR
ncbi:MAG TPA: hypothetical protein VGD37_37775 [Kofleriaceae bacterium]